MSLFGKYNGNVYIENIECEKIVIISLLYHNFFLLSLMIKQFVLYQTSNLTQLTHKKNYILKFIYNMENTDI